MSNKDYFDTDGNPVTLRKLIRLEPEWAHSRIKEGEKALAELAALKEADRWVPVSESLPDTGE